MIENPQAPVEFEGVALTASKTIDEEYIETAARTFYVYALTRPIYVVVLVLMTLAVALYFALSFGDDLGYPVAAILGSAILVVTLWIVISIGQRRLRTQLRTQLPIGSQLQAGFTDHSIALRSPSASSVIEFAAFTKLVERPGLVILKQRGSAMHQILPAQLFTDSALADIRASFVK